MSGIADEKDAIDTYNNLKTDDDKKKAIDKIQKHLNKEKEKLGTKEQHMIVKFKDFINESTQWCWYCDNEIKTSMFNYDDDGKPVHIGCSQELMKIMKEFPDSYKKIIRDMKDHPVSRRTPQKRSDFTIYVKKDNLYNKKPTD